MTLSLKISNDLARELRVVKDIKARMQSHQYINEFAQRKEQSFIDRVESTLKIYEWCERHLGKFEKSPNNNNLVSMAIKLPHFDADNEKVVACDSYIYIMYKRSENYHWIYASHDFMGMRLDWRPTLFYDILQHQDDIDAWCAELTETLAYTDFWWHKY